MLPKHKNPTKFRRFNVRAHAPYNFIPLAESLVTVDSLPDQDRYHEELKTGYIQCTLTTKTPLYTRTALEPSFFRQLSKKAGERTEQEKIKMAPFFSLDGGKTPIIPGSSLRGMIRNLLEITSFSKLSKVTDEQLVFRAVADRTSLGDYYREKMLGNNQAQEPDMKFDYPSRNVHAGYLIQTKQGWQIQPAISDRARFGESFVHVEFRTVRGITNGRDRHPAVYDVWVIPVPRKERSRGRRGKGRLTLIMALAETVLPASPGEASPKPGMVRGKLVVSGWMHGKHMHRIVYEPDTHAKPINIPDEKWDVYIQDRQQARGKPARNGDPIFYLLDDSGKLVFFGNTMMFRLPYDHTPLDMIPKWLREERATDIPEAIFGVAPKKKDEGGVAGRVFFTDARTTVDDPWLPGKPIVTPKVLSSPKPTTFQHYLIQTNPDDLEHLWHWGNRPVDETLIRGYKLYWHVGPQKMVQRRDFEAKPAKVEKYPKQYTRIVPVREGVDFSFRVYFENLRDWELGALLWALQLPINDGQDYRHKLGMAKPLGLGTVHITIDDIHLSDRKARYQKLFSYGGDNALTWYESTKEDNEDFVKNFIDYVWQHLSDEDKSGARSFYDIERIRMLLRMLKWPGPTADTSYMQIKNPRIKDNRGKPANEFRDRPVLPDPLHIDAHLSSSTDQSSTSRGRRKSSSAPPQPRAKKFVPPPEKPASKLESNYNRPTPQKLEVGDIVEGVIFAIEHNRLAVDIGEDNKQGKPSYASMTYPIFPSEDSPGIKSSSEASQFFHPGEKILVLLQTKKKGKWRVKFVDKIAKDDNNE